MLQQLSGKTIDNWHKPYPDFGNVKPWPGGKVFLEGGTLTRVKFYLLHGDSHMSLQIWG